MPRYRTTFTLTRVTDAPVKAELIGSLLPESMRPEVHVSTDPAAIGVVLHVEADGREQAAKLGTQEALMALNSGGIGAVELRGAPCTVRVDDAKKRGGFHDGLPKRGLLRR